MNKEQIEAYVGELAQCFVLGVINLEEELGIKMKGPAQIELETEDTEWVVTLTKKKK